MTQETNKIILGATNPLYIDSTKKVDSLLNTWIDIAGTALEYMSAPSTKDDSEFKIFEAYFLLLFFNELKIQKMIETEPTLDKIRQKILIVDETLQGIFTQAGDHQESTIEQLLETYKMLSTVTETDVKINKDLIACLEEKFELLNKIGAITQADSQYKESAISKQMIDVTIWKKYYLRRRLEIFRQIKTALLKDETYYTTFLKDKFFYQKSDLIQLSILATKLKIV
jgi:hypothetical protein